jgi:hypothetical protein
MTASYKKRGLTKKQIRQEEAAKARVSAWFMFVGLIIFALVKSPSFSGIGTSSHYLTIENQEFNRKMSIKEEIKALQEQIERDKENTTLARFIRNLESRIYAQLSRQLVENLFGDTASTSGTIELEGNIITYTSDGQFITLKITDPDGNITEITLPIGSFTF